jgi:hypothetical protein
MENMTFKFFLGFILITSISLGQTVTLDSCGLDQSMKLNRFEIEYLDNVLFADSIHDFNKGFDFNDKSVRFFTCNSTASKDGFITKDKFFQILKSSGTRIPRGIFQLNEKQKQDAGPIDAVILINCKMYSDKELIKKLKEGNTASKNY